MGVPDLEKGKWRERIQAKKPEDRVPSLSLSLSSHENFNKKALVSITLCREGCHLGTGEELCHQSES